MARLAAIAGVGSGEIPFGEKKAIKIRWIGVFGIGLFRILIVILGIATAHICD